MSQGATSPEDFGPSLRPDPEGIPVAAFAQRLDNLPAAIAAPEGMMLGQDNTEVVGTPAFKQANEMSHETGPFEG